MSFVNHKMNYNIVIPTPFFRRPFEFTIGFRNTFFLFVLSYGLAVISMIVNNYNIGIFSLLLVFLIVISYYLKPENEYIVLIYALTPAKFLFEKIKIAFGYTTFLCFPIFFSLAIFDFSQIYILIIFTALGYLYLIAIILAKYSAYPNEMELLQGIITALCIAFPPMLIFSIPFFLNQAISNLKRILK